MKRVTLLASLFVLGGLSLSQATLLTFDSPVVTSPTDTGTPGEFYVDRYAPAGFQSATLGGENVLQVDISAADSAANRPGSFSSGFYNTQGYKMNLDPVVPEGANFISADLYLDPAWASLTNDFRVGLWATGEDSGGGISQYPIISFGTEGVGAMDPYDFLIRQYDSQNGAWVNLQTLTVGDLGNWINLGFANEGGLTEYFIDGASAGFDAGNPYTTVNFDNVILQAYNNGEDYTVYWDNLYAVPEPSTFGILGLMGALLIGGYFVRRRRQTEQLAEIEAQA